MVVPNPQPSPAAPAWRQQEAFARRHDVLWPAHVTSNLMAGLEDHTHKTEKLAAPTINERVRNIRAVYTIAVVKEVLEANPAAETLGAKLPKHLQGREKRKPFTTGELQTNFGSALFTQHLRSRGQSGEASYWIPLVTYYSGARREEVAGLLVDDVRQDASLGWYLHITDLPSKDDDIPPWLPIQSARWLISRSARKPLPGSGQEPRVAVQPVRRTGQSGDGQKTVDGASKRSCVLMSGNGPKKGRKPTGSAPTDPGFCEFGANSICRRFSLGRRAC